MDGKIRTSKLEFSHIVKINDQIIKSYNYKYIRNMKGLN